MSSKNKRGAEGPPAAGRTPRQEVDRLIAKGWFKDAIKQAKLLHRAEPTPEHHRLLERAYFLRAQELRDGGMPKAAQEVAGQLLDFGITDTEMTEPTASLLMAVGLERQALELQKRLDKPEALDRLTRQAADQAVLHPERASASPEIRDGAGRIRSALEALAAPTADGPDALEGLRDVSRNSPFADWRLFARGLAAFRRGDDDDAKANWDRLDPNRAASRIARALSGATDSTLRDGRPSPKLEGLERRAFGEPILGSLRELGELVGQGLWPEAVRKLTLVRLALRRLDPRLAVRLTEALYSLALREATGLGYHDGQDLLKGFTKAAEPLPIDPRWNRFWALAWEGPQGHPEEAGSFWRRYRDDLETSQAIQPDERPLARALVLTHQGQDWAGLALDLEGDDEGPRRSVDEEALEARRTAVSLLEESLALFPSHRATYQALLDAHEAGGQPEKAAGVAERLIKALPDDFDTLMFLTRHYFKRDEPARGLEFALRARKLKPLDPAVLMDEWACRVALARHLAIGARWDEARAELATAAGLKPDLAGSTHFAARKACLEIKAGATDAAKKIIDEAIDRLPEPTPVWLAMAIEARRFQLPPAEVDLYEARWQAAAPGKVRGETAGALADLLGGFLDGKITYPGRDEHVEQVIAYLRRTTRIKYNRRDDLAQAATFVGMVSGNADLAEKLAKRGLKLFPAAPEFPMMLGATEMAKGPFEANMGQVRKHFESALKLAQAEETTNPRAAAMIPKIKEALAAVNELFGGPMMGMPFMGGSKGGPPGSFMDAFRAMMEEELDDDDFGPDDDDDGGYWGPSPAPLPAPRPKKKKKKKR
jgi:tetratricopeptide (TPR) repeat protein